MSSDGPLIVTRFPALVDYLRELGLVDDSAEVLSHATIRDIQGRHVVGVLPYWLASYADRVTEVQIRTPKERRGRELTLDEIRFFALKPRTYRVREVEFDGGDKRFGQ